MGKLRDRMKLAGRKQIIARQPRVQLLPLHRVVFSVRSGGDLNGRDLPVINISVTGLGVLCDDGLQKSLSLNKQIEGTVRIGEERFEAVLGIKHSTDKMLGGQFVEPSGALISAIQRYLELELSALELRPVDPELLQRTAKGEPLWFFRDRSCELYVVLDQEKVIHFHGSFCGFYFEGGDNKSVRFGVLVNSDDDSPGRYPGSDMIKFESQVNDDQIKLVDRFIQYVPALNPVVSTQIRNSIAKALAQPTS